MKKVVFFAALAAMFSFVSCGNADELKVMSYNIRLEHMGDGDNAWPNRKEATIEMLETIKRIATVNLELLYICHDICFISCNYIIVVILLKLFKKSINNIF